MNEPAPAPVSIRPVPVTLMRGGTSKGVFLDAALLPAATDERDRFVLDLMGSPDPMQIDGLGGTYSSTSKVMAVQRSRTDGVDAEYTFLQVGIADRVVDGAGNCGNLTAAVGAYAVNNGLVAARDPVTTVRLLNVNTGIRVDALVPVQDGRAAELGSETIPGVPHPGAPIETRYLDPAGGVTGSLFPTGARCDTLTGLAGLPDAVEVSVVDVAHPVVFVEASALGVAGDEPPVALNGRPKLLAALEEIRAECAVRLGRVERRPDAAAASAAVPRIIMVSPPAGPEADIATIGVSLGRIHHALPGTGALATAAALALSGTLPARTGRPVRDDAPARIAHPKGVIHATARVDGDAVVRSVGLVRTARRLMEGTALVRTSAVPGVPAG